MKPSILTLALLLLVTVPLQADESIENARNYPITPYSGTFSFQVAEPVNITFDGFVLVADSGSLKYPLDIQVSYLPHKSGVAIHSNMENVGWLSDGVRLLPNGEHFSEESPALISLAYDPARIPQGYSSTDIYTYYCEGNDANREGGLWHRLERVSVDTVHHVITSYTTHFTDFANAVIKVPDMPESKAYVPTAMTDIPDPNILDGIPMVSPNSLHTFGSPTGDNSGSASLTYPITVPTGRHGLQPDVSLRYNSDNTNGMLGVGWSLPMQSVTIDTRWGVPRYWADKETEAYLVNGEPIVGHDEHGFALPLPHQDSVFLSRDYQTKPFYFRDRRNNARVIRHGQTPQDYWWEVTSTEGVSYYYGRIFDATHPADESIDDQSVLRDSYGNIGYWALTAVVDLDGNYVLYENNRSGSNIYAGQNIYLSKIRYTGNIHTGVLPEYTIDIAWRGRTDAFSDGRLGLLRLTDRLLCSIGVMYESTRLHTYYLNYTCSSASLYKSRLASIDKSDAPDSQRDCNYLDQVLPHSDEYAGSRTTFSYSDAPQTLFGTESDSIASQSDISRSMSGSWNIGGVATVGLGLKIIETSNSAGGHYNFSMQYGRTQSLLLDLNGDGLPDLVYEKDGVVSYRRQILTENSTTHQESARFAAPVTIQNLNKLSHEVSRTHNWGLQLSFVACLSYSNPITLSYTDIFFTDINADGLPDLVTPDGILFNHLSSSGVPTFSPYTGNPFVTQHNSSCPNGSILFTGTVDERLECEVREVALDSLSLSELPEDAGWQEPTFPFSEIHDEGIFEPHNWHPLSTDNRRASESDNSEPLSGSPIEGERVITSLPCDEGGDGGGQVRLSIPSGFYEDGYTYRIERGKVIKYGIETICKDDDPDPAIETVRVWVAENNGYVHYVNNTVTLRQDSGFSRRQSRKADGVKCILQRNHNNQHNSSQFTSTEVTILHTETIAADDYTTKTFSSSGFTVSKGDILVFRLVSGDNSSYDDVNWDINIYYTCSQGNLYYNSNWDYVCSGERPFIAPAEGEAIIRYKAENDYYSPIYISFAGSNKPAVTYSWHGSTNDTYRAFDTLQLSQGDTIRPIITCNGGSTVWGNVHFSPQIEFRSHYYNSDSTVLLPDTAFYYPDVNYPCSVIDADSIYTFLFGKLHKGWGRFVYNNLSGSDTLDLCSLINTEHQARQYASQQGSSWQQISLPQDSAAMAQWDGNSLDSLFDAQHLYQPLSGSSRWIPLYADSRTERWIPYGNIGFVSKTGQSNSRNLQSTPQTQQASVQLTAYATDSLESDIPYYDSALPASIGAGSGKMIRKSTKSVQHSLSGGAAFVNVSRSWGTYSVQTDYIDLNGDGFPDMVGPSGVQYTMPWGGLGRLTAAGIDGHESRNISHGQNFSGTVALMKKMTGNSVTKVGFSMEGSGGGVSQNVGETETDRSFFDLNGDGLPDIICKQDTTVRYNLGYRFSTPQKITCATFFLQHGSSASVGANGAVAADWMYLIPDNSFGIEQYSISGGVDGSVSMNIDDAALTDINGDGLPDLVRQTTAGTLQVAYNTGMTFTPFTALNVAGPVQKSHTLNIAANISGTLGISFMGTVKLCFGLQGGGGFSKTHSDIAFIDMNADGCPDQVVRYPNGVLKVRYNETAGTNLLHTVTNATGQAFFLQYTHHLPSSRHRQRHWDLTLIDDKDGNNPWAERVTVSTRRQYGEAFYDNHERTDYGYHQINTNESDIRFTTEQFVNTAYILRGHKTDEGIKDSHGNKYLWHRYYWSFVNPEGHAVDSLCKEMDAYSYEDAIYTDYFDGSGLGVTTRIRMRYDQYHNLITYYDDGDLAINDDDWYRRISYLPTTSHNLVSLPVADSVMTPNNTLLRLRYAGWYPNGRMYWMQVCDPQTSVQALTSLYYDPYGNIEQYRLPPNDNNERVNYNILYDAVHHDLPIRVRNQFGETAYYDYEPRWGKPVLSVDTDGQEITYTYDYMGRLSSVLAPQEQQAYQQTGWLPQGSHIPYTVKYTYNNVRHNLVDLNHDTIPHAYILKQQASCWDNEPIEESAIYSARGELLQHKKLTEVYSHDHEVLTDGIHLPDALGRVCDSFYPSISSSALWLYDGTSNSTGANATRVWYDVLDRDTLTLLPDGAEIRKHYSFEKDCDGISRLATISTDPLLNTSTTLTAPQGWLTQATAADGSKTCYRYNCIGELMQVTDADGYVTQYQYDRFGRMTERNHPDANHTYWYYDPAGNIIASSTQRQKDLSRATHYRYCFNRMMAVIPDGHPWDSVRYNYDYAGRLAWREDKTGEERLWYDALGNIRQTLRRIYTPAEDCAYQFLTIYNYDSFGRMCTLTYPDGEEVVYKYNIGGDLIDVKGYYNYLNKIKYDELGHVIDQTYGNGYRTTHTYTTQRQWLHNTYTVGVYNLQNLNYSYDPIGNIVQIKQNAPAVMSLGTDYTQDYVYDNRYRLRHNGFQSSAFGNYSYIVDYSPAGRLGNKSCNNIPSTGSFDIRYGYDYKTYTHQPRVVFDYQHNQHLQLYWDRDGNLEQIQPEKEYTRFHLWDDNNRLLASIGGTTCGFYGNAADGNRAYKLTGVCSHSQLNNGTIFVNMWLDDAVLYPNPYITVTPQGYTKHYFAGSERIATSIGGGGLCYKIYPVDVLTANELQRQVDILKYLPSYLTAQYEDHPNNEDINHNAPNELQYLFPRQVLFDINCSAKIEKGICVRLVDLCQRHDDDIPYYYHPDHLGGAAWITDQKGNPVQYLHYAPYGELIANQKLTSFDERYKFTGKERDAESGYDFFGARYYWSTAGIFTSVDPLAGDFPQISPYAYTLWNPIRFIDPDGRGPKDRVILARELVDQNIPYAQQYNSSPDFLRTSTSPEALAYMDCSEFVCRVLAGDGVTPTIESHSTRDMLANMMSDETKFIKSDIPQAGDIVLWAGHTGIVESYNEKDGNVTVLHATQYGPIKDENGNVVSYKVSSTRREKYPLNAYYRGKRNAFFYRPVNETPDVFEGSSTIKLQEVVVKPSEEGVK